MSAINTMFKGMDEGFGNASSNHLEDLRKALSAGYQTNSPSLTGGGALRVQSLESSLKVLTNTEKNYVFWQDVEKKAAYSTVEEFNTLLNYGPDNGGFNFEGVLPEQDDTSYQRNVALVKFLGTTRSVSHPMTLVRPAHGEVIALENKNGILWILRRLESAFFTGNSTLMYNGAEGAEFNGLSQQISANNVIDALGNPLSEELFEEGANLVSVNFGTPTHAFLAKRAMADFGKTVYSKERFMPQQTTVNANGEVGYFIQSIQTQSGIIGLRPDVFIQNTPTGPAIVSPNAPAGPASLSVSATANGNGSFWKEGPGTYLYGATLGNNYGESAVTTATTGNLGTACSIAVTAAMQTNTINVAVTLPASFGAVLPQFIGIYRSQPNGSVLYRVARVGLTTQTLNAVQTVADLDTVMANTSEAYLGEMSDQVIAFKQLAPLLKMDLAVVGPAFRWMILLYGVLILYAPAKWVKYINVGSSNAISQI
jgi:hypothetical protein